MLWAYPKAGEGRLCAICSAHWGVKRGIVQTSMDWAQLKIERLLLLEADVHTCANLCESHTLFVTGNDFFVTSATYQASLSLTGRETCCCAWAFGCPLICSHFGGKGSIFTCCALPVFERNATFESSIRDTFVQSNSTNLWADDYKCKQK